ncbi:MAG: Ig-like domain-containing protein [Patescibacteria group bacterium]|jgi:pimeloyl-ACP methyl ester carboxylesterase
MKNLNFKVNSVRLCFFQCEIKTALLLPAKLFLTLALAGFFVFGAIDWRRGAGGIPEAHAEGIVISENTTWEKGEVRVIDDSMDGLSVMPGVKLTINPGVIIKLGKNMPIMVAGEMEIKGSPEEPVIITSLKNDSAGGDTNGDGEASSPAPGDWVGILAGMQDANVNIDYAEISYGGGYDDNPIIVIGAVQAGGFSIAHSSLIHNTGFIVFNETPLAKINYSNIYFDETSCYEEEGARFCDYPMFGYQGAEPLDATNNYWDHPDGPTVMETAQGPEDAKGVLIQGNINFQPFLTEPWKPEEPEVLEPVILVPGIMGSWNVSGRWQIDPIFHTYDNLMEAFIAAGYKEDSLLELKPNLFTFPYDWRADNNITAGLLKEKIRQVKERTGASKVDLVAHSMGGLIARSYIQGGDYQEDINQVIFLGTPHLGAPESYLRYGGAYFQGYFGAVQKYLFQIEAATQGYLDLTDYIRAKVLSAEQLLPAYNYLKDKQPDNLWQLRPYPLNYPQNIFLENLNSQENIDLLKQRANITNIISDLGQTSTLNYLRVVPDLDLSDNKWQNGYPENLESGLGSFERGNGDGTVPLMSANSLNGVEIIETNSADHENLPTVTQKEIINALTGQTPENYFNSKIVSTIKKWLFFRVYSPVDFAITAPDGKIVGKDFNGDTEVNEIPDAFYSGFGGEAEFILIPNPEDGEYEVKVQGVQNGGEYTVAGSFINNDEEVSAQFTGTISASQVQEFKLDYTEESEDPIGELEPEDDIAPVIAISAPTENAEYLRSEKMNIEFTTTDDFSGIATTTIILDGTEIATTTIDLFYSKTGEHVLEITAKDRAGNIGSSTVKFKITATPDSVISDIKRLYDSGWITDRTTSKILIREIEDIKWYLKRLDQAKGHILKSIERIKAGKQPEKLKVKLIQRYNEEIARLEKENSKKLNMVFDRIERSLQKYLKRNLINQGAYDIIKDDVNYLRGNL